MASEAFQKPPTQVEAVLSELQRALLEGDYVLGSRLNVEAISRELGVSRAPVRDALRILEGERQVVYAPHRGYVIAAMSLEDLRDLYRVRELLETEAVALAVPVMGTTTISHIWKAAQETLDAFDANDRVAARYANRDFHFTLFSAPGHSYLVDQIRQMWNADAYRSLYMKDMDAAMASAREHFAIAEAAADGDVKAVVELSNAHRDGELNTLTELVGELLASTDHESRPWHALTSMPPFQ